MQGDYNNKVVSVKKKKSRVIRAVNLNTILAVLLVVSLAVCVTLAITFASPFSSTFKLEGREFYCLVTGEFEDETAAFAEADSIKQAGGAGYIYNDGTFKVFADVYSSKSDAQTVLERINSEGKAYTLHNMNFKKFKLDLYGDKETSAKVNELIRFPYTSLYDGLHQTCVQLDKGEMSDSMTLYNVNTLLSKTRSNQEQIRSLLQGYPTDYSLGTVYTAYNEVIVNLENVINSDSAPASARIREALGGILADYYGVLNDIAAYEK